MHQARRDFGLARRSIDAARGRITSGSESGPYRTD